jgi:hypothetical protein
LHLHTLLHTVRSISQVEDELCTLLHEVERTGVLSPTAEAELHALLNRLPSHEYGEDLEAVRSLLSTPEPTRLPAPEKKRVGSSSKVAAAKPKGKRAKS